MKQVEKDSQGKVTMGPGTLYGSLKRMLEAGLVEESTQRLDPALDDKRRIYYKITELGKKALAEELERYRHLLSLAEEKKLFPEILAYGT
jgi:DNA-binding PadR family transcriptional regulator